MFQNEGVEIRSEQTYFINLDGEIVCCHLLAHHWYNTFSVASCDKLQLSIYKFLVLCISGRSDQNLLINGVFPNNTVPETDVNLFVKLEGSTQHARNQHNYAISNLPLK